MAAVTLLSFARNACCIAGMPGNVIGPLQVEFRRMEKWFRNSRKWLRSKIK